jgi:hypothetical protein
MTKLRFTLLLTARETRAVRIAAQTLYKSPAVSEPRSKRDDSVRYLTLQSRTSACLLTLLNFPLFPALAAGHTINLSRDVSTSPVVGYNVYRGATFNGPYTKLNSRWHVNRSYVVAKPGQIYAVCLPYGAA